MDIFWTQISQCNHPVIIEVDQNFNSKTRAFVILIIFYGNYVLPCNNVDQTVGTVTIQVESLLICRLSVTSWNSKPYNALFYRNIDYCLPEEDSMRHLRTHFHPRTNSIISNQCAIWIDCLFYICRLRKIFRGLYSRC